MSKDSFVYSGSGGWVTWENVFGIRWSRMNPAIARLDNALEHRVLLLLYARSVLKLRETDKKKTERNGLALFCSVSVGLTEEIIP